MENPIPADQNIKNLITQPKTQKDPATFGHDRIYLFFTNYIYNYGDIRYFIFNFMVNCDGCG